QPSGNRTEDYHFRRYRGRGPDRPGRPHADPPDARYPWECAGQGCCPSVQPALASASPLDIGIYIGYPIIAVELPVASFSTAVTARYCARGHARLALIDHRWSTARRSHGTERRRGAARPVSANQNDRAAARLAGRPARAYPMTQTDRTDRYRHAAEP